MWRFDENAVRAIVQVKLGPAERLVEVVNVSCIGACENESVSIHFAL